MIPDSVTLIVKAPNQQIEDQNIDCLSSWSVKQLKGHLSQVYPTKPAISEQKIIYSGQLLEDNSILKDILRTYEDPIIHTMHLVCTSKRRYMEQKKITPDNDQASTSSTSDGVRRRNVPTQPTTTNANTNVLPENVNVNRPETRQNDQNREIEMQNYLSSFANYGRIPPPYPANPSMTMGLANPIVPGDPASMANQVLMMQQAYMHYMQQYANMWQAAAPGAIHAGAPMPTQPLPDQAQPNPAPQAGQAQAHNDEEDNDWLDNTYQFIRFAILSSLVYVYSSPLRLFLVIILAGIYYLHQSGFFRDLAVNARVANNQPNPVQPQPNPAQPQPAEQAENTDNQDQAPNNVQITPPNNQQSILAVTWLVVTTFFSSLIPELNQ